MRACIPRTQALGFKAKAVPELAPAQLDKQDMEKLLKRGGGDDGPMAGAATSGVPGVDGGDKISGLGYTAA